MDYALTLLFPILGGLLLGVWLTNQFGVSPIWTIVLAILGMVGGIGIMYKRHSYPELYGDKPHKTFRGTAKKTENTASGTDYRDAYKILDEDKDDEDKDERLL